MEGRGIYVMLYLFLFIIINTLKITDIFTLFVTELTATDSHPFCILVIEIKFQNIWKLEE
jgi:hypothetical protein